MAQQNPADEDSTDEQPDMSDVPLDDMALAGFPDFARIVTRVEEDEVVSVTTNVRDPEDTDRTHNEMLAMDGREAAKYVEARQRSSDADLNAEIDTVMQRKYRSNEADPGPALPLRLSDFDRLWLARREKGRRMKNANWNPEPDAEPPGELPNA